MLVLVNVILPVFLVAGVGALAQPHLKLDSRVLSRAAFHLFSPAIVLDSLINSDVSSAEYGQMVAALALTVVALWLFGEVIAKALRLDAPTRAAFLVAILLMNSGNYGMPVNFFAFGEPGLVRASLCVTFNTLVTSTVGVYLAARGQAAVGRSALRRTALRRVLAVPALYAAILGVVINLTGWNPPETVVKAIHLLGQGLVPTSLVILGIQFVHTLQAPLEFSHVPALIFVILGRLVVAPVVANFASGLVGLEGLSRDVVVLEMATPAAIMSLILANEFKSNSAFVALCILATTFASLITVTLWLNWLM